MEQLLQRIVALVPPEIDPNLKTEEISKFIGRGTKELPTSLDVLPYRVQNIFYLLADHYFKNRDLTKSVKYYVSDLANYSNRFDSWAGLALSKASILETKLNTCDEVGYVNQRIYQNKRYTTITKSYHLQDKGVFEAS